MTDAVTARVGGGKGSGKDVLTESKLTLLGGLLRRRPKVNGDAVGDKSTAKTSAHCPNGHTSLFIQLCSAPTSRHHSEFQGVNFIPAAANCKSGACFPGIFTLLCLYSVEFALILILVTRSFDFHILYTATGMLCPARNLQAV